METTFKMEKLGDDNHMAWFSSIEHLLVVKDCWLTVTRGIPEEEAALLAAADCPGAPALPTKTTLTATFAATGTTEAQSNTALTTLSAIDWRPKDELARATIHLNVKPTHYPTVQARRTAADVCKALEPAYKSRWTMRAGEMRRRLHTMKKKGDETMREYINRGTMLQYEMSVLELGSTEAELVAALLASLPAAYRSTATMLELMTVDTLTGISDRLVAAEAQLEEDATEEEKTGVALAAAGPPQPEYIYDQRVCYGCEQVGHIRRNCPTRNYQPARQQREQRPAFGQGGQHSGGLSREGAGGPRARQDWRGGRAAPPQWGGASAAAAKPGARPPRGTPARGSGGSHGMAMTALCTSAMAAEDGDVVGSGDWIIDSGASHHMTGDAHSLHDLHSIDPIRITTAAGTSTTATCAGEAKVTLSTPLGPQETKLRGVLLVPDLAINLFSFKAMMTHGFGAYFFGGQVEIVDEGGIRFVGRARGNIYVLPRVLTDPSRPYITGVAATAASAAVWHSRLAHAGREALLGTRAAVHGLEMEKTHPRRALHALCEPCVVSKQARGTFPPSDTATTTPLALVHTDVCGPMPVNSLGGSRYFVTVLDDYSGMLAAIPIKTKADAGPALQREVARWETKLGRGLQRWRSDRGGEYMSRAMASWSSNRGVTHETTAPYTPQQNGKAERCNLSIVEKVGAIMVAAGCAKTLWAEAVTTVAYTMNRTARAGQTATPYELWSGARPDVNHLRTFGCRAYVLTPATERRKLDPRSRKGVFIGYEPHAKAYRVLVNGTIKVSRDVTFDEGRMGTDDDGAASDEATNCLPTVEADWPTDSTDTPTGVPAETAGEQAPASAAPPPAEHTDPSTAATPPTETPNATPLDVAQLVGAARQPAGLPAITGATVQETPAPERHGRFMPARLRKRPARLGEAVGTGDAHSALAGSPATDVVAATALAHVGEALDGPVPDMHESGGGLPPWWAHPTAAVGPSRAVLQGAPILSQQREPPGTEGLAMAAHGGSNPDKMKMAQAMREPDWPAFESALAREVAALWDNGTFELTYLPPGASVLPFQLLCERKRGADGAVTRHKGRGVACGNWQVPGRDFVEVWAPVIRRATLLAMLALTVSRGLLAWQLDVETAFLNGPITEAIYVRQPKGFERGDPRQACRLRKAVYGLKQAARQWYLELAKLMGRMGMVQSKADPCLFIKDVEGERVYLVVYVDDLLLMARKQEHLDDMKRDIMNVFASRDIGPPTYFLGLHVDHDKEEGSVTVSQRQYATKPQ